MNTVSDDKKSLISFLYKLRGPQGRAALAELRRAAADPQNRFRLVGVIGPYLPDDSDEWRIDAHLLVSMLFAIHGATRWSKANILDMPRFPDGENKRSFGASLRGLKQQLGSGADSLDLRVSALLDTNAEDLAIPLRGMVQRIATAPKKPIPIDYYKLLNDLINWEHGNTRLRWAREYWQGDVDDTDTDSATDNQSATV